MNLKKMTGLVVACGTLLFVGLPQGKSVAAVANCKIEDGKHYQHRHRIGASSMKGDLVLLSDGTASENGKSVALFSGSWTVGTEASNENNITVQTSGSTFMMIRKLEGELKQMWVGTCQSDGLVTGDLWDPAFGKNSFAVKL